MEKERLTLKDIEHEAIYKGMSYLCETHGIDASPEQFNSYLEVNKVKDFISELKQSKKFKKLKRDEKIGVLAKGIQEYIVKSKPFNEQGQKILEGGLESMINKPSLFGKIFSTKEGRRKYGEKSIKDYLSKKEVAERLSYEISKNPQVYAQEMPELVKAAQGVQKSKLYGAIADVFYGLGAITKETYGQVKAKTHKYTGKVLEIAGKGLKSYVSEKEDVNVKNYQAAKMEDYIPNPSKKVAASILGIFGIGLIISSGLRLTGNVIGNVFGFGSGFIGLVFLVMGMSFFLLKKEKL